MTFRGEELRNLVEVGSGDMVEFRRRQEELVQSAILACEISAHSYRGFKVGCAVLVRDESGRYWVEQAGNFKLFDKKQSGSDLRCAERNATEAARYIGAKKIVGIVTASRETSTSKSADLEEEQSATTLHPCGECKVMFKGYIDEGFMSDSAPIITVRYGDGEKSKQLQEIARDEGTIKDILHEDAESHVEKSRA